MELLSLGSSLSTACVRAALQRRVETPIDRLLWEALADRVEFRVKDFIGTHRSALVPYSDQSVCPDPASEGETVSEYLNRVLIEKPCG